MPVKRILRVLIFTCFGFMIVCSWGQVPRRAEIVPGQSVAAVKLGSSISDVQAALPQQSGIHEKIAEKCAGTVYHWIDLGARGGDLFAYAKDDRIYLISSGTQRFTLRNGITRWSLAEKVERLYPHGKLFVLVSSGSKVVGGRDLRFWVDKKSGVAFELFWNQSSKRWLVGHVDIFVPGTEYQPAGCISPPQEWKLDEVQSLRASAPSEK
jgi:hypothetical protein